MMYLNPIVKKVITNKNQFEALNHQIATIKNDREMLSFLLRFSTISEIESAFEHHYGIKYKNLNEVSIDTEELKNFDMKFLKKEVIIPLSYDKITSTYELAISNLMDRDLQGRLKKFFADNGKQVSLCFAFEYEILDKLENLESNVVKSKPTPSVQTKNQAPDINFNATEWVNKILNKGIELGASDVHIERLRTEIQARYRVDGLLTNKEKFSLNDNEVSSIYVRLKIISNMDIVESRRSQDGRIDNYTHNNEIFDMRVSTVNTIYGEKFVLRLLKKSAEIVPFSSLGFTGDNQNEVLKMLKSKNGIIYLAGATGSGKTTTLYTMIDELKDDSVNIYTIENPIEKTVEDINQIQIDEANGTNYPTILSALLRQDPDVIVVGEIRDSETAELSIRASLTGHLVLSTIHSNSAVDSLSRLSDMGVEPYLVGASMVGVLSQRLLRKLCPECKVRRESLKGYEEDWIKETFPDFNYEDEKTKGNFIYEAGHCSKCSSGYKGRVAAVEVLSIDEDLRAMISRKSGTNEIEAHINKLGYKTLKHDGILKVLNGITSMNEAMGQL